MKVHLPIAAARRSGTAPRPEAARPAALFALFALFVWGASDATPLLAVEPMIIVEEEDEEFAQQPRDAADDGAENGAEGAERPLNAQISRHILKLAESERASRLKFMEVVIDDVARLCELEQAQRDQLDLAAKGAAERSMKDWHEQAERYFRTRLDGVDGDTAKEMLEGMGNVNFGGNRSEEESESLDLWKETLRHVLDENQIARYEAVLDARRQARVEAFALMSLTTLDSHLRLTPEQKSRMGEVVREAASDYLEDVQRYWGDYFEKGMLMSLANAIEEEELKKFLTSGQFERLKEATSNFDHFWDQKRRLKRARAKAGERRRIGAGERDYEEREAAAPDDSEEPPRADPEAATAAADP